jgi:glycosyltransferase involved in cell wall biosynthesis
MHPDKGIDTAIHIARRVGRRLVIAAKMREDAERAYYRSTIEPLLDGSITYVGEADHATKLNLLRNADALLNPIPWPEPFGLVMIEALACGTPVIATPNGAAPEIVTPGANGWLASTIDDLVAAVDQIPTISRRCRTDAVHRFSRQAMAAEHEQLCHHVLHRPSAVGEKIAVAARSAAHGAVRVGLDGLDGVGRLEVVPEDQGRTVQFPRAQAPG